MSESYKGLDVPLTLVTFTLAPGLAPQAFSPVFKENNSTLSLVSAATDDEGLPIYSDLIALADQLHALVQSHQLLSLKSIGQAGLGHALATSSLGNSIGAEVTIENALASAPYSFLLETKEGTQLPSNFQAIGKTTSESTLTLNNESTALDELEVAYTSTLEPVYHTVAKAQKPTTSSEINIAAQPSSTCASQLGTTSASAQPKVLIPTFPGTNCEYDSAHVFQQAGADTEILVFRNLTPAAIEESINALAKAISQSQFLFLPGGFSAGDEPDGSAKFIATILRNPRIADAVADLHQNRKGLILGICNGFQALVKSGLLGSSNGRSENAATLAHNPIARHISTYVTTRIANTNSPWLANCEVGDLHTIPVSHGEGRFLANQETLDALVANGQIATQYTTPDGIPTMEEPANPNQSALAIEGITSPCGLILGKMGHTERRGIHVAKNIPGEKHQPLFKAGVSYFK